MGIFCEISLCRPADGRYVFQPGSVVSGAIRYSLDEEYVFTKIIVSCKGIGKLHFQDKSAKRRDRMSNYNNEEAYVDIDNIIYCNEKDEPLPVGHYETPFSFQLPFYIPASLDYTKDTFSYYARCIIEYYVRIKFERPGRFNLNKHYKKAFNVISGQIPKMRTEPIIYGDQKNIVQLRNLFSSKKGIVRLKATMATSVLRPGESVKVDYEVENSTNITVKGVKTSLLEVDKYTSLGGHSVQVRSEVEDAESSHGAIQPGETVNYTSEIVIPNLCASIDHSKIFERDYSILTMVELPMPHINLPLEIPLQVITRLSTSFEECNADVAGSSAVDQAGAAPPTYWEAMGEEKKEPTED